MERKQKLQLGLAALGWSASALLIGAAERPLGQARAAEPSATVTIQNFSFEPQVVTVAPGTQVTWVNHDPGAHALVGRRFRSSHIDGNGTFSFTFREPGTYEYYCPIHPQMRGAVVVK